MELNDGINIRKDYYEYRSYLQSIGHLNLKLKNNYGKRKNLKKQPLSGRLTDYFAYAGLDSDSVYPAFKIRAFWFA